LPDRGAKLFGPPRSGPNDLFAAALRVTDRSLASPKNS